VSGPVEDGAPATAAPEEGGILRSPEAGGRVIRGTAVRVVGYGIGIVLGIVVSVLLLRHLGVADFGRYVTVAALLGIVAGVTDAGLTAVGARELSLRDTARERDRVLRSLIALRLIVTPIGVALALGFALVAGYDRTLVLGTVLGGLGLILVNLQATAMIPLSVDLRIVRLTVVEVMRYIVTLVGVFALVVAGAALLPFFAVQIAVGVVVLAITPALVGRAARLRPAYDGPMWRSLARDALPIAIALAMNVIYFRVLVVEMSLIADEDQVGFFATSFRVLEVLLTLPVVILSTALPVLAVAHDADRERLRYGVQRLTEIAVLAAVPVTLALAIPATPLLQLLGGDEYTQAGEVLTVQSLSLLALFVGQAWQIVLISMRLQRGVAIANSVALVVVIGLGAILIPLSGALGAAWATVIGESSLALCLLGALALAGRDMVPDVRFAGRVLVALVPAVGVALIPGPPRFAAAALSIAVFAVCALAAGAVPREVMYAFSPRLAGLLRGGR
jgi:O-antigen/teichoic acid export membrane protein